MRSTLCHLSYLIISYLITCVSLQLQAQHPTYWQITDDDGLPSMTVYELFQDSKGFIWLGTDAGIARYDGNKFKTFKIKQSKSNAVSYIQESKEGVIWFMNFSGQIFLMENNDITTLDIIDPESNKNFFFHLFLIDKQEEFG